MEVPLGGKDQYNNQGVIESEPGTLLQPFSPSTGFGNPMAGSGFTVQHPPIAANMIPGRITYVHHHRLGK